MRQFFTTVAFFTILNGCAPRVLAPSTPSTGVDLAEESTAPIGFYCSSITFGPRVDPLSLSGCQTTYEECVEDSDHVRRGVIDVLRSKTTEAMAVGFTEMDMQVIATESCYWSEKAYCFVSTYDTQNVLWCAPNISDCDDRRLTHINNPDFTSITTCTPTT